MPDPNKYERDYFLDEFWDELHELDVLYEDEDDLEYHMSECGLQENDTCLAAGTEHCSFWCPFKDYSE